MRQRPASGNMSLDVNAPAENISVRRVLPVDLSGAIAASEEENRNKAQLPETIAKVITTIDDYNIKDLDIKEKADRDIQEAQNDLELRFAKTKTDNELADRYKMLNLAIEDANQRVKEGDAQASYVDAVSGVLEEYSPMNFQDSQYGNSAWSKMFSAFEVETLKKAQESDLTRVYSYNKFAFNDSVNLYNTKVLNGDMGPLEATQKLLSERAPQLTNMSDEDRRASISEAYNSCVASAAMHAIAAIGHPVYKGGPLWTVQNAVDTLYGLVANSGTNLVFESSDGQQYTYPVSITDDMQRKIIQYTITLLNKEEGDGVGSISEIEDQWKTYIGNEDLENGNIPSDSNFMADTPEGRAQKLKGALAAIQGTGKKPDAMLSAAKKIFISFGEATAASSLAEVISVGKADGIQLAQKLIFQLERDLNNNKVPDNGWGEYKLLMTVPGTSSNITLISVPNEILASYYDTEEGAKQILQAYCKKAKSFLADATQNNPANLLRKYSKEFRLMEDNCALLLIPDTALTGSEGGRKLSPAFLAQYEQQLANADNWMRKQGYNKTTSSDFVIKSELDFIRNAGSTEDSYAAAVGIAAVREKTGHMGDYTSYYYRASDDDKKLIAEVIAYDYASKSPEFSNLLGKIKRFATGGDAQMDEAITASDMSKTNETINQWGLSDVDAAAFRIMGRMLSYAKNADFKDVKGNKWTRLLGDDSVEKVLTNVLNSNFVKTKYIEKAANRRDLASLFSANGSLTESDISFIDNYTVATHDIIKRELGMDVRFDFDKQGRALRATYNGRPIKSGALISLGGDMSEMDSKQLGALSAQKVILNTLANDPTACHMFLGNQEIMWGGKKKRLIDYYSSKDVAAWAYSLAKVYNNTGNIRKALNATKNGNIVTIVPKSDLDLALTSANDWYGATSNIRMIDSFVLHKMRQVGGLPADRRVPDKANIVNRAGNLIKEKTKRVDDAAPWLKNAPILQLYRSITND